VYAKVSDIKQGQRLNERKGVPNTNAEKLRAILAGCQRGVYDRYAAYLCSVASAWVYSDSQTTVDVLTRLGLPVVGVRISAENDAMLVAATADLLMSPGEDGTVALLCFRGTEPFNPTSWLTDFTVDRVAMPKQAGYVHGGMYRNLMAIWDDVVECLEAVLHGEPIPRSTPASGGQKVATPVVGSAPGYTGDVALFRGDSRSGDGGSEESVALPVVSGLSPALQAMKALPPLRALHLTGHSLGGAMAAFAAIRILHDRGLEELGQVLRGVYTFGQPLLGDATFVKGIGDAARAVECHIYRRDVVPHLPPNGMGVFVPFGCEHLSEPRPGKPDHYQWCAAGRPAQAEQISTFVASAASILDFGVQQILWLRRHVHLPYSLENHLPRHYLECSLPDDQPSEFDPLIVTPAPAAPTAGDVPTKTTGPASPAQVPISNERS
jgi:hypothetical protein